MKLYKMESLMKNQKQLNRKVSSSLNSINNSMRRWILLLVVVVGGLSAMEDDTFDFSIPVMPDYSTSSDLENLTTSMDALNDDSHPKYNPQGPVDFIGSCKVNFSRPPSGVPLSRPVSCVPSRINLDAIVAYTATIAAELSNEEVSNAGKIKTGKNITAVRRASASSVVTNTASQATSVKPSKIKSRPGALNLTLPTFSASVPTQAVPTLGQSGTESFNFDLGTAGTSVNSLAEILDSLQE